MFPQIFGKYMLEREIAAGGMARVYLATLRGAGGFEKRLVVKQIRPELASDPGFVERFVKEAKTAVELSHPNIVPVYELGAEQGVYYIAMEHCDGATLSDLLAATGPLDAEEGAYLGVEVCRALDYAHRRAQVIHRDVTPRNVLIDEEGAVRVIDFGIAAPAAEGPDDKRVEVFGSPGHMPPEQLAGEPLTPATDVFAVGVLLYEALSGRPAFRRATARESRAALEEVPPPLDRTDPKVAALADIVARAMQLDERARPESAEALARPLRELLRSADAGDVARRLGERVRAHQRRATESRPWLVGEGLTGLVSSDKVESAGRGTPRAQQTPAVVTRTFASSASFTQMTRRLESDPPPAPAMGSAAAPGENYTTRKLPSSPSQRPLALQAPEASRGRILLGLSAAGLAMASAVVLFSLRAQQAVPTRASAAPGSARTPAAPTSVPARAPAPRPLASVRAPSAPHAAEPVLPGTRSSRAQGSSASAAHTPESVVATLSLTALPGTSVNVAGHEYTTPVTGLSLPAGRYQVTFRNATWDGPVSTHIVLLPGRSSRVHADFTNEPPRVVVR